MDPSRRNLRLPLNSPPEKAAEESGNSPPGIATLSRSVKRTTAGVIFNCICGVDVEGIILFVNRIPSEIKCCNCGSLHKPEKLVSANFGTDCKHSVRTYDSIAREYTCNECFQVIPGTLKLRASGVNLPDGSPTSSSSIGDQVGSRPPLQEGD